MDLILWRHAEAHEGSPDMARALTAKGIGQARRMADWLAPRLPRDTRILASPAIRACQTADALAHHYETRVELAPDANGARLLAAAGWPDAPGTVLLVGHQPALGEAASLALFGAPRPLILKKAGLFWITSVTRGGERETLLKAALTLAML